MGERNLTIWDIKLDFPLNWSLKLAFSVLPERPTPCLIRNGKWLRALRVNDRVVPIKVEIKNGLEKPILSITSTEISMDEKKEIEDFVLNFHGLGDVKELYEFMDNDAVLRRIKRNLYGFGRAGLMSATVYEGIIKAIIQQQISLRVAEMMTAKLVEDCGSRIWFDDCYVYDFPDAETIAGLNEKKLRSFGLSSRKASYVKEFSLEVTRGFDPEGLKGRDYEEIIEILTSFRGIGKWSAELVMVASMGLNVIPAGDLGVRKAISHFYFDDRLQSPEVIRDFCTNKFNGFLRDCLVYLLMAYRMHL